MKTGRRALAHLPLIHFQNRAANRLVRQNRYHIRLWMFGE